MSKQSLGGSEVGRARMWIGLKYLTLIVLPCLFTLEIGWRLWLGPDLGLENFASRRTALLAIHHSNQYDPLLGWRLKAGWEPGSTFRTGPEGLIYTSNAGFLAGHVPQGAWLAIGDSFTAGSEGEDIQAWPAVLQGLLGEPVLNASAGGWGADQIALRAQQLRPQVLPKGVLLSLMYDDIARTGYKVYAGGAKPFFTLLDRQLQIWGLPPDPNPRPAWPNPAAFLGYSAVADTIGWALAPQAWTQLRYEPAPNDPVQVTCALMAWTKPTLLVIQWGGSHITSWIERPYPAQQVLGCVQGHGIPVLDLWEGLKGLAAEGQLESHFVMHGTAFGHMSPKGNAWVAAQVAAALRP